METTVDASEETNSCLATNSPGGTVDALQFAARTAELLAFEEEAATKGIITISKSPVSSEQLSLYFYEASNTWAKHSFDRLKECADEGLLLAKGFLMRMYAFGSGLAKQDTAMSIALAESIVPILKGESAYRRYLQSMRETFPDLIKESDVQELRFIDYLLSSCYHKGLGVECSESFSFSYALHSAALCYAPAQNYIGYCYEKGVGTDIDFGEALKHYHLAAEQQHAAAQYNLGLYYKNKKSAAWDEKKAFSYFLQSATQNNIDSQYFVGIFYQEGLGVEKSDQEAVQWFRRSAEQGCLWSQNSLGRCYKLGLGVEKSFSEGAQWYLLAAQAGYAISQHNLAFCYKCAEGVTHSDRVALYWFECSADRGDKDAQYHAGMYHLHGANPHHYLQPHLQPTSPSSFTFLENHNFTFLPSWKKLFPVPITVENNLRSAQSVDTAGDPASVEYSNAHFLHSDHIPINVPRAAIYLEKAHRNGVVQATYYFALCLLHPQYHTYLREKWAREARPATQIALCLRKKITQGLALLEQIGASTTATSTSSTSSASSTYVTHFMAKYLLAEFYFFGHSVQEAEVSRALDLLYAIVQPFLTNMHKIFVAGIATNAANNNSTTHHSASSMYGSEKTPAWMELVKNAVVNCSSNMNYHGRMAMSESFSLLAYAHSQYLGRLTLLSPASGSSDASQSSTGAGASTPVVTTTTSKKAHRSSIHFLHSHRESVITSGQQVLTPIVNTALATSSSSSSSSTSMLLLTTQEKGQHQRFRELYYFVAYCWRETISTPNSGNTIVNSFSFGSGGSGGNGNSHSSNSNGGSTQYYYYHWAGLSRGLLQSYHPSPSSATPGPSEESVDDWEETDKETTTTTMTTATTVPVTLKALASIGTSRPSAAASAGVDSISAATTVPTSVSDEGDEDAGMEDALHALTISPFRPDNAVVDSLSDEAQNHLKNDTLQHSVVVDSAPEASNMVSTLAARRHAFLQQQCKLTSSSFPTIFSQIVSDIANQKDVSILSTTGVEDPHRLFVHLIHTLLQDDDELVNALTGRSTSRTAAFSYAPFVQHRYSHEQFSPAHVRFSAGGHSGHSSASSSNGEYAGYGAAWLPLLPTLSVEYPSTVPTATTSQTASSSRKKTPAARPSTAEITKLLQHVLFAVYLQRQHAQSGPQNPHPCFPNLNVPELLHKRDPFLCYNLALSFYHASSSSSLSEHYPITAASSLDTITSNLPPPVLTRDRSEAFRFFRYAAEGAVFAEDFDYGTSAVTERDKIQFVNPYAYFALGWCYRYGEGVPPPLVSSSSSTTSGSKERRHYVEARRWFLRAAEHERYRKHAHAQDGDADDQPPHAVTIVGQAAWELGVMWWKGRGGERSQLEAWYWILRSVIVTASSSSSSSARTMAEWRRHAIDWLETQCMEYWKTRQPTTACSEAEDEAEATTAAAADSASVARQTTGSDMDTPTVGRDGAEASEEVTSDGRRTTTAKKERASTAEVQGSKVRANLHTLGVEDLAWLNAWRETYLLQWRHVQREYWRRILLQNAKVSAKGDDSNGDGDGVDQLLRNRLQDALNRLERDYIDKLWLTIFVE